MAGHEGSSADWMAHLERALRSTQPGGSPLKPRCAAHPFPLPAFVLVPVSCHHEPRCFRCTPLTALPCLPPSHTFSTLPPVPALSATQCHSILAAGPALVEWTLGQQPGRGAGAGRKRKRGREAESGRGSGWGEQGQRQQAHVSESDVARFNSLVLRLADAFSSSSSSATRLCILKLFLLHLTTAASPLPLSPPAPPSTSPPSPFPASHHATSAAAAAPSLTPAALRTPPGAGRCDAGGDAMPDVSSMCDVSLLHWRWRREGERVRDVWRGARRRGERVVTREGERESGGAAMDSFGDDGSSGDSDDCSASDGADSTGSDGGAGGGSDWAGVLTARKLLNPTQVITRIAPLLSRSRSFPLPPTAAAAAATAATSHAGTAGTTMPAGTAAATAAGAVDSVDSLESRCLALRLIGCLAPLAADVAHVQELVVRAAMEAEGQQEVSEGSGGRGRKRGIRGSRSSITLSSLLASRPLPFLPSHPNLHAATLHPNLHAATLHPNLHAATLHPNLHAATLHPNLHAATLHSKSPLSLPLHPYFPLQLSSHPNLHAALLAATFLRVVSAPFILNPPSFPPFYVSFPFLPLSLLPILLSLLFLPPFPNSPTLSSIQLSSFSTSSPPWFYCSTTLPPTPLSPYIPTPQPPPQQRHAALFALTFLCDVSPPFALHTLPLLLSLALPASPPPPLPLSLKRHLHRSSHLPLPQQTKQPRVRGNAHRSQEEADGHVAGKRQQQQPDDSPAAHAPLHPHSFAHSLSPHTLLPLALHTPLLTSSSHMPRVSRPLARWRGREEGEEGVRVRVAAVVVKCLAGHEERAVRRVAWQVAVCLLSAFPCAPWSPLLRSWVCALQAQLG
ncbi:unnamed protein product [Closterium sp. Naga37s-1]|nr:unnamed protein product [Closterium sp. Naga37s-1]